MAIGNSQLYITRAVRPRGPGTRDLKREGGPNPGPGGQAGDITLTNILTLIPGDTVSIYIVGKGIDGQPLFGIEWPALCFWAVLGLCILIRAKASTPVGSSALRDVNWRLVAVSAVAFFLWAHAITEIGKGPVIPAFASSVAGFFAMIFGIAAPILVPAAKIEAS